MLRTTYTHKCGHEWVTVFIKGASRHELKMLHKRAAETVCPKCEDKENINTEPERSPSSRKD